MASAITRELADNILADHPLEREFSNHYYKNTYAIADDSVRMTRPLLNWRGKGGSLLSRWNNENNNAYERPFVRKIVRRGFCPAVDVDYDTSLKCDDSGSAYTLANDVSQLSDDVDRWIYGSRSRSTFIRPSERVQPPLAHRGFERPPPGRGNMQAAGLQNEPVSYTGSGFTWCVAAILLPLITARNSIPWLCTQTAMYNATELLASQFARLRCSIQVLLQRIAREPVARDLCAAALDTLLVVYAIGFLGLSLYQASVFG